MGSTALAKARSATVEQLGREALLLSDGSTVHVGRLSINQSLALSRVAAEAMRKASAEDIKAARDAMSGKGKGKDDGDGSTGGGGWVVVLGLLSEQTVEGLLQVVLDGPADCNALALEDLVVIIEAVGRHNDWGALRGLFTRALKSVSAQPSETSSERDN